MNARLTSSGALVTFRCGSLTSSEYINARIRHHVSPVSARNELRNFIADQVVTEVGRDHTDQNPQVVYGLTDKGCAVLESAMSAVLLGAEALVAELGTDFELIACRPEWSPKTSCGDPIAIANGNFRELTILQTIWPTFNWVQQTSAQSLNLRRSVSWWPWTVPDPCTCLWIRSERRNWRHIPVHDERSCDQPANGVPEAEFISSTGSDGALVSCVMPTRNRRHLVPQAIRYFFGQRYSAAELIIVDDSTVPVDDLITHDGRMQYVRVDEGSSIGAKMNAGCEVARGDIIAQWDDDDWHGPNRIMRQVAPILSKQASITALQGAPIFHVRSRRTWSTPSSLIKENRITGAVAGTFVFLKRDWQRSGGYPDLSMAERSVFLKRVLLSGGKLQVMPNRGDFVVVRHDRNTWTDDVLGIAGWSPEDGMPWFSHDTSRFYSTIR